MIACLSTLELGRRDGMVLDPPVVARQQAEAQFQALLESAPDAIVIVNQSGQIVLVNSQTEHLFGYPRTDLLHQPVELLLPEHFRAIHEEHRRHYLATLRTRPMGSGLDLSARHQDGREFPVEVSLSALQTLDGLLVTAIIRDITERQEAEAARLQLIQEQAQRAAEQVVSSLQHLQAVTDIGLAHLSLDALLPEVLNRLRLLLASDEATILLLSEDGQSLVPYVSAGLEEGLRHESRLPLGRGVAGRIAASRQPLIVEDPATVAVVNPALRRLGITSLVGVPLLIAERVIGAVHVGRRQARRFTQEDVELLALVAERIAVAIDRTQLYQQLQARERQLHEVVGKLLVAQEEERHRVAYEVHAGLAQVAASAYQHLQAFARYHRPRSPQARERLDHAVALVQQTVHEARRIIANLRPTILDDFGLAAAVRFEVEALEAEGWQVRYEEALGDERLPAMLETALFRVIQEALTNVRKHAQTTQVEIRLIRQGERLSLAVRDWGQGFEPEGITLGGAGERVGLAGMRERIALLWGRLSVESQPGVGTRIMAEVPVPTDAVSKSGAFL